MLDRRAMSIPADRLSEALEERIHQKQAVLEQRQKAFGDRIYIHSYMENIGWPELFGYDMNRVFTDAAFAMEMELRQRIFWTDNSLDDAVPGLWFQATVGMYYDITLFGEVVTHTPQGVPLFGRHPIADTPDLSLIPPIDFHTGGMQCQLLALHQHMQQLNRQCYGGKLTIGFPGFGRGPLDVYIQMRTYENFIEDTAERPEFVHALLERIASERVAYNVWRRDFLGEAPPEDPTCGIDDDWVYCPFISPEIFRQFVLPVYRRIARDEGPLVHFHTCGSIVPIVHDLLDAFPSLKNLDVGGWNDFEQLDQMVDPEVAFSLAFKNTFVLTGSPQQHRDVLRRMAHVSRRRKVTICAQAMVRLHDTYDEDLARMNAFIALARQTFAEEA